MELTRKTMWWWGGGAVAFLVLIVGLANREPVPGVMAARVVRENLNTSIASNGKVEPIEPQTIRAQLATFVERVAAVEGQAVRRGQLLLVLDSAEARAELARVREELLASEEDLRAARSGGRPDEVAQLESDLRKNDAELVRLRREREALERLVAQQAATKDELAQNQLALARAEAQRRLLDQRKAELARRSQLDVERASLRAEQARNQVRALEEKVRSAQVTAPVDGTLYSLPVKPRDFVRVGDLLAEVANLRRVRVRAFVDEPELGWLEQGQPVEITWEALPNRAWPGRTEMIPKQVVSRGARSVGEVLCSVENEKLELLPNTNVNVRIRVRERVGALVVPRGAVHSDGVKRFVFLAEGGRLQRREIKVGISSAAMYEVLHGLAEGNLVALPGATEPRDGMVVRVTEQPK